MSCTLEKENIYKENIDVLNCDELWCESLHEVIGVEQMGCFGQNKGGFDQGMKRLYEGC